MAIRMARMVRRPARWTGVAFAVIAVAGAGPTCIDEEAPGSPGGATSLARPRRVARVLSCRWVTGRPKCRTSVRSPPRAAPLAARQRGCDRGGVDRALAQDRPRLITLVVAQVDDGRRGA